MNPKKLCLVCSKRLKIFKHAPHKKFCNVTCQNKFHSKDFQKVWKANAPERLLTNALSGPFSGMVSRKAFDEVCAELPTRTGNGPVVTVAGPALRVPAAFYTEAQKQAYRDVVRFFDCAPMVADDTLADTALKQYKGFISEKEAVKPLRSHDVVGSHTDLLKYTNAQSEEEETRNLANRLLNKREAEIISLKAERTDLLNVVHTLTGLLRKEK